MSKAIIAATIDGTAVQFTIEDIDFDMNRDDMALSIGRKIVDGLYGASEESQAL